MLDKEKVAYVTGKKANYYRGVKDNNWNVGELF